MLMRDSIFNLTVQRFCTSCEEDKDPCTSGKPVIEISRRKLCDYQETLCLSNSIKENTIWSLTMKRTLLLWLLKIF